MTGAKVVISSSWRGAWIIPYGSCGPRGRALKRKMNWFHCEVLGITPSCTNGHRETEIRTWIQENEDKYHVTNFVVLDDEDFDLQGFIGKELVKTNLGITKSGLFRNSGLSIRHVIQAVKILNNKEEK